MMRHPSNIQSLLLNFILCFFTTCLLFSCGESNRPETIVSGRVYDPVTQSGWMGAKVVLFDVLELEIVEEGFTDAEGRYEIRYRSRDDGPLMVGITPEEVVSQAGRLLTTCGNETLVELNVGQSQSHDFALLSTGLLRLTILNENCLDENDRLELTWRSEWSECENDIFTVNIDGCNDFNVDKDSTLVFAAGNQIFEWTVTRGNTTETYVDSVVMGVAELLDFDINY